MFLSSVLLGGRSPSAPIVIVGASTDNLTYGWSSLFGSVLPSKPQKGGQAIASITTPLDSSPADFRIVISGSSLAKTFFTQVVVENGAGSKKTFATADATFSSDTQNAIWKWGDGTTPVWQLADAGENHIVILT